MTIETVKLCSACSRQGNHRFAEWRLAYPKNDQVNLCTSHKDLADKATVGVCEWTKIRLPNGFKA